MPEDISESEKWLQLGLYFKKTSSKMYFNFLGKRKRDDLMLPPMFLALRGKLTET